MLAAVLASSSSSTTAARSLHSPSVVSSLMAMAVAFASSLVAPSSLLVSGPPINYLTLRSYADQSSGTAVQTTAHHTGQFIGGRFILGFGGRLPLHILTEIRASANMTQHRLQVLPDLHTQSSWLILAIVVPWRACTTTSGGLVTSSLDGLHMAPTRTSLDRRGHGAYPLCSSVSCQELSWLSSCSSLNLLAGSS